MKRASWPLVAATCGGLVTTACGSGTGAELHGDAFTVTLPAGWSAPAPQSEQGGTLCSSSGPNNAHIELLVFPFNASFFEGGNAGTADLATLLQAVGYQQGTTPVDVAPPSSTTVGSNPAMEFNATLLESDGVTKTQSETIDTRYGSDLYYIVYGSKQANFAEADSAARAMLATWKWTAPPATVGTSPPTPPPTPLPTPAVTAPPDVPVFETGSFSFNSQPGDYIGQGQQRQYLTPPDIFSLYSYGDKADLSSGFRVDVRDVDGETWDITVMPPRGQLLHTGSYDVATRATTPGSDAGLEVTADARGCATSVDSFTVAEISTDVAGAISSLDMTFTQHRVRAAGIVPMDWLLRAGHLKDFMPLEYPHVPGYELAGTVEAVGEGVTELQPGDDVFGRGSGA